MTENLMTTPELVDIAIDIGERLLKSGAEIYRVEESLRLICNAYGADSTNVYAVPTSIIVTICRNGEAPVTNTRRITARGTDLDCLDKLNALCRSLCTNPLCIDEVRKKLQEIECRKVYNKWIIRMGFGFIGGFFSLLFGAGIIDACVSFCICFLLKIVLDYLRRNNVNSLFENIVGGFIVSTISYILNYAGIISHFDFVIIGSIMTLVPGLAITNSMRDLIAGDTIAGITKFAEAMLVAVGIAIGVALPLLIAGSVVNLAV